MMMKQLLDEIIGAVKVFKFLLFPKKWLVAGPYTGELGWEMMVWQGYVRALRRRYKNLLVISYPFSSVFYEDCTFIPQDRKLIDSGFGLGVMNRKKTAELVQEYIGDQIKPGEYDLLLPHDLTRIPRRILLRPVFPKLGKENDGIFDFDVVFHFRDFERKGDLGSKSYPREDADRLFLMCREKGLSCACIGHPEMAYCPEGCEDRRSLDMAVAIDAISKARLVCGGSSAPMHLASLCAKPMVVWIGHGADIERYISYWNPRKSPVFVVTEETFQPSPDQVFTVLCQASDDQENGWQGD